MKTMTMPSVGLQMDFSKDVKAMVRSEQKSEQSDFLQQIKSATEELQKQTTEVKKQAGKTNNTRNEASVKSEDKELLETEVSEDTEEKSNQQTAVMAELVGMLVSQEIPIVVDVKEILIGSEPKQNGVMALGEVGNAGTVQAVENGSIVELERLQTITEQNQAVQPIMQEATEQVVLAGQQATEQNAGIAPIQNEPVAKVTNGTPQTDNQVTQTIKDTQATVQQEVKPQPKQNDSIGIATEQKTENAVTQPQQGLTDKGAVTEISDEAAELITQNPKTEAGTEKSDFKAGLEKAEVTVVKSEQSQQQSTNSESSEQSDSDNLMSTTKQQETKSAQAGDEKELFVTDKLKKQMDKLEEMLLQGGMTPAQVKNLKTVEATKAVNIENLDMAPQVQQVTGKIFEAMDNGVNELIMQLQPKELGKLMIKLSMENNRLTVNITAENMHAQKAITEQLGLLESSIKSQNVIVDRINVTYDSANNMNSSYNQSGLGRQFDLRDDNRNPQQQHQQSGYMGRTDTAQADEVIQNPRLMIIGNDMLNYVV